jgi:dihydrofolate reductase
VSIVSLVVAMADNGVIGKDGHLPWRIAGDMRRFKALTLGKPCIMGRKTWESLPKKPLPDRLNIVVTRDGDYRAEGATVVHSFDEAMMRAGGADEICVIGGAELYRAALSRANLVHLTQVHGDIEGDTRMPLFDRMEWRETAREDHATPEGLRFSYVTLRKSLHGDAA